MGQILNVVPSMKEAAKMVRENGSFVLEGVA